MCAGVLAGRWPPAATPVDRMPGREYAPLPRPATDREVSGAAGMVAPGAVEAVVAAAGARGMPWTAATARANVRRHADGDRTERAAAGSGHRQRLPRAAGVAACTRGPSYVPEVPTGVVVLCEQSSWCWPAHDGTVTDPPLDLDGHLVHLGVSAGVPADPTPRELTDPMRYDVLGERSTRLDLTVAAPAGTLTVRITEAS